MFFSSIKRIDRLKSKDVKYLLKSCYWEKLTFSKLWFSEFKKFVSRLVFREFQFIWIGTSLNIKTSCCNLKIRSLWAKLCVWLFYYFNFERRDEVLKSNSRCILLNKNINFDKNKTESKMENPTHSFKEMNLLII